MLEGAKYADEHGLAAVWTPERHFHPFGGQYPNPSLLAAALAVRTSRVQLRAGSVVMPLQNPLRVAEEWAVVDNLSNGRVGISVASGWAVNDFVLAPDRYTERHALMYRDLETVRALWRGESVPLKNGKGEIVDVRVWPRPVQPQLPVWVTAAKSPRTFESAGSVGANVLTHLLGQTWDSISDHVATYRAARARAGHSGRGWVTLMVHTFLHEDLRFVERVVRPPLAAYMRSSIDLIGRNVRKDATPAEMARLVELGVEKYIRYYGMFGPPETCVSRVARIAAADVDEIACLIDFGIEPGLAIEGLGCIRRLADLATAVSAAAPVA